MRFNNSWAPRFPAAAAAILSLSLLAFAPGCGMLFWSDSESYVGGHWRGEGLFLETVLPYERKTPMNPLNQNVLSRNYRTKLLAHDFAGGAVKKTRTLAEFKGWVPRHGLQLGRGGDGTLTAVMMVGLGDGYGSGPRHVAIMRFASPGPISAGSLKAMGKTVEIKIADQIAAAVPSPDGTLLALVTSKATMRNKTGRVDVLMHRLNTAGKPVLMNRIELKWSGAPGSPNLAWAGDSSRLFVQLDKNVVELGAKVSRTASRFPACMTATLTGTNISDGGLFFYREQGKIMTRKEPGWIARNKIPMISSFGKIGAGCP